MKESTKENLNSETNSTVTEGYILFEEENNIHQFGYDYTEELAEEKLAQYDSIKRINSQDVLSKWNSQRKLDFNANILGITAKCNANYKASKAEELKIKSILDLLKVDLTTLCQYNLKNRLDAIETNKRQNIPKLWIYDYTSTYATNYTDEQRINKSLEFIKNLM